MKRQLLRARLGLSALSLAPLLLSEAVVDAQAATTADRNLVAPPATSSSPLPLTPIGFDGRYVNDNQGEVDSADIVDGSLTGADVSTTGGDVTFGGGATVTAQKGVFGLGSNASGSFAAVTGGRSNTASGYDSTVSGGYGNAAVAIGSTISGGRHNNAMGYLYSTVGGGAINTASGIESTVSGGVANTASGYGSTISGGKDNVASGNWSIVPGGVSNTAAVAYSFAAGRRARANHQGAFVWGDSLDVNKTSSTNNQFNVYASGGARIFSNSAATTGVLLAAGGGSWTSVSDRNAKENVEPVDGLEVLECLARVPIATWNYKTQDDAIRHMGPMAQDFYAAFGLGLGDTSIDTIDPDGVALAAIQGLNERNKEFHRLLEEREAQVAELRERVLRLEARMDARRE